MITHFQAEKVQKSDLKVQFFSEFSRYFYKTIT